VKSNEIVIAGPSGKFSLRYSDPHDRVAISDGGGDKIINGSAAAGFKPFPWLPAVPSSRELLRSEVFGIWYYVTEEY
jgi:hypothetical protein